MLLDIIKSIDLFASLTSLTFLKNLFFFNFIFQYWIDLELSFIIYSIFLFIKSSLSQKISRYWIGAWSYDCLFLLSYSWINFFFKKNKLLIQVESMTQFTGITCWPKLLDLQVWQVYLSSLIYILVFGPLFFYFII
jgi:hypothetical protein